MKRDAAKREVLHVLRELSAAASCASLTTIPDHILLNQLFSCLCHPEAVVRWNAVRVFGWLVPKMAGENPEAGRIVMRRFLWSMNDESGGIGWGIPEAMAEVMCHSELLRDEYLHMIFSYMREDGEEAFQDGNFVELPMLQRSIVWGVGRLCQCYPQLMRKEGVVRDLRKYLDSPDRQVIGLTIWALGQAADPKAAEMVQRHIGDDFSFELYDNSQLRTVTVSQLLKKYFQMIN